MLVTKSRDDSMGVGSNRCTKLVTFVQASFVLHRAMAIYLCTVTFQAVHIKNEQLSGSGQFEMVEMSYRDFILPTA